MIEAFNDIIIETSIPHKLFIVGSGDGFENKSILEMAKSQENKIHFQGQLNQEDLSKLLRESDIFVLPSFYDGFPKVLLESLACGCKAIITDLPGIKDNLVNSVGITDNIVFIPMPDMKSIDEPNKESLPYFVKNLKEAIKNQISTINKSTFNTDYSNNICKKFGLNMLFNKYLKEYKLLVK